MEAETARLLMERHQYTPGFDSTLNDINNNIRRRAMSGNAYAYIYVPYEMYDDVKEELVLKGFRVDVVDSELIKVCW